LASCLSVPLFVSSFHPKTFWLTSKVEADVRRDWSTPTAPDWSTSNVSDWPIRRDADWSIPGVTCSATPARQGGAMTRYKDEPSRLPSLSETQNHDNQWTNGLQKQNFHNKQKINNQPVNESEVNLDNRKMEENQQQQQKQQQLREKPPPPPLRKATPKLDSRYNFNHSQQFVLLIATCYSL
jgi:hypothetical protein